MAERGRGLRYPLASLLFVALTLLPSAVIAHQNSRAAIAIAIEGRRATLTITVDDLDTNELLAVSGGHRVTRDEAMAHTRDAEATTARRIRLRADGAACELTRGAATARILEAPAAWRYALTTTYLCTRRIERLDLRDDLFFEVDPQHLAHVTLTHEGRDHEAVLGNLHRDAHFDLHAKTSALLAEYFLLGLEHILTGTDHLAFLLALLLALGHRRGADLRRATLWLVTAFSLSHALSLTASVLGLVHIPSRPVEVIIAASIAHAGFRLLGDTTNARPALFALGFGLVHGLGFAGALEELGLPAGRVPSALLVFNLGIELGQLVAAAALLPWIVLGTGHRLARPWFALSLIAATAILLAAHRLGVALPLGCAFALTVAGTITAQRTHHTVTWRRLAGVALGLLGLYWAVARLRQ